MVSWPELFDAEISDRIEERTYHATEREDRLPVRCRFFLVVQDRSHARRDHAFAWDRGFHEPDPRCTVLKMDGIASVAVAFGEFARWFAEHRKGHGTMLDDLHNGFEGWVKVEFCAWLVHEKKLRLHVDVGLEHNALLDQRHQLMDRTRKLCDLWVRADNTERFHYVEFKAPFAEHNQGKMLTGAGHDFWYLSRLRARYERAVSGSAVILGVRFDEAAWDEARRRVRRAADLDEDVHPVSSGALCTRVRWDVWTHDFTT